MVKDTTTITTYKFTRFAPKRQNAKKVVEIKFPLEFEPTKETKKRLNVKKYIFTDVLNRVD